MTAGDPLRRMARAVGNLSDLLALMNIPQRHLLGLNENPVDKPATIEQVDDRNPEQNVLDAIDALVDEQLNNEASGYDHCLNEPKCAHCGHDWHGLTGDGIDSGVLGCPGAFGEPDEVAAWVEARRPRRRPKRPLTDETTAATLALLGAIPALTAARNAGDLRCRQCSRHLPDEEIFIEPTGMLVLCRECHDMRQNAHDCEALPRLTFGETSNGHAEGNIALPPSFAPMVEGIASGLFQFVPMPIVPVEQQFPRDYSPWSALAALAGAPWILPDDPEFDLASWFGGEVLIPGVDCHLHGEDCEDCQHWRWGEDGDPFAEGGS